MTNAKKVKVSKEVAEAIAERMKYNTPADIVGTSAVNGWEERGKNTCGCLNKRHLNLDTLINAVYFGYEVEETPQDTVNDRIKEIGKTIVVCSDHKRILEAEIRGIKLVVDVFNLKGVNA